jgi:hypothetical protein
MYGTEELLANLPDFERMKIRGGKSPYGQPTMPGEQRLIPRMQEHTGPRPMLLDPSLKEARRPGMEFLDEYLPEIIAQLIETAQQG